MSAKLDIGIDKVLDAIVEREFHLIYKYSEC